MDLSILASVSCRSNYVQDFPNFRQSCLPHGHTIGPLATHAFQVSPTTIRTMTAVTGHGLKEINEDKLCSAEIAPIPQIRIFAEVRGPTARKKHAYPTNNKYNKLQTPSIIPLLMTHKYMYTNNSKVGRTGYAYHTEVMQGSNSYRLHQEQHTWHTVLTNKQVKNAS